MTKLFASYTLKRAKARAPGRWRNLLPPPGSITVILFAMLAAASADAAETYLLLDSRVVEKAVGVKLEVGTVAKHPANPLFKEDKAWEVRFDNLYANVLFDETIQTYRCWYSPFIVDPAVSRTPVAQRTTTKYTTRDREMGICYAESKDGLHWEKPELGLVEFNGSTANNLVLRGPHGAGIFQDAAESDPARRFKLFCHIGDKTKAMGVSFSADGMRWSEQRPCPEIKVPGDTHNNAFWSPELKKYVGITRMKDDQRLVAHTVSSDFIHWTEAKPVLRADKQNQAYAMPVFKHAGVYLGLLMIFRTAEDRVHCELAWSPDTVEWHRIDAGQALIPTSDRKGDYDWGCVYAAANPVFRGDEVQIYYGASNGPHTSWRDGFLALATLKRDRFAGYAVRNAGTGEIVVKLPATNARTLSVNAEVKRGEVRAELLDALGNPVKGFGAADCEAVTGDRLNAVLKWKGGEAGEVWQTGMRLKLVLSGEVTAYAVTVR